ncbi:MAG: AMP-binding protein, partial [Candidatus Marinimicrobia bacterium]|nr:AMP-binding protein [Candidatus Neomarinimicrobiota bacterium]
MSVKKFNPPLEFSANAHVKNMDQYQSEYNQSIGDRYAFWAEKAERISWVKKWDSIGEFDYVNANIKWFEGGKLNVSYNCIDRHVAAGDGDKRALTWEGNNPEEDRHFTYAELLKKVQKFANVLKGLGVEKGDRVCMYMQMVPQLPMAMLACARIGAVHSIVFGAFSPDSLRDRINDSECKILITQDTGVRGTKQNIPMKSNADKAVAQTPSIEHVVVVRRTGEPVDMVEGRDVWWQEAMSNADPECAPVEMDAEDPLFILYTSGSTGKPKGVLHTTGGYLVYVNYSFEKVFDFKKDDIYWCTADIGWITGHSYIVYGPMSCGATSIMFEGVPNFPDFGRFWQVVDKHQVTLFYTAPTALRALMKEGNTWVEKHDLSSLRLLGTVGETIKEPEWIWYHKIVGKEKCPIIDTWWQTET